MTIAEIKSLIAALRSETRTDSISPDSLGAILDKIIDSLSSLSPLDKIARLENTGELPESPSNEEQKTLFLVNMHLYAYEDGIWQDCGSIQGPQGIQGVPGERGMDGAVLDGVTLADTVEQMEQTQTPASTVPTVNAVTQLRQTLDDNLDAAVKQTTPVTIAGTLLELYGTDDTAKTYKAYSGLTISAAGVLTSQSDTTYLVTAILIPFHKGDIFHFHDEATKSRTMRFCFIQENPVALVAGMTFDILSVISGTVHDHELTCPYEEAWLIYSFYNSDWISGKRQYKLWHTAAYEIAALKEETEQLAQFPAVETNIFGGTYYRKINGREAGTYNSNHYIDVNLSYRNNDQYRAWRISNDNYTHIRAYTRAYSAICAIAFYVNGAYTAPQNCIVSTRTGFKWYEADVPEGCTVIYVSLRGNTSATDEPNVKIELTQRVDRNGLIADLEAATQRLDAFDKRHEEQESWAKDDVCRTVTPSERNELPAYYLERPETPTLENYNSYLETKIQTIPKGKRFIFVTDSHWRYNTKISPAVINYVRKRTGIPFVIFGGDAMHRPANQDTESQPGSGIWTMNGSRWHTPEESRLRAQRELSEYCEAMKLRFGDHFLFVTGNHDLGLANLDGSGWTTADKNTARVPFRDIVRESQSDIQYRAVYDEAGLENVELLTELTDEQKEELRAYIKQCYYVDDPSQRLRFIVTYTGQGNSLDGIPTQVFGASGSQCLCTQLKHIAKALMTLPEGYDVILAGHWFAKGPTGTSPFFYGTHWMLEMINAYRKRQSYTVVKPDDLASAFSTWIGPSAGRTFNFAKANHVGRVILVNGHRHGASAQCVTQGPGRYEGSLPNYNGDSYPWAATEAGRLSQYLLITVRRDGGTSSSVPTTTSVGGSSIETDCAFEIITVTDDNHVHCTRVGYGSDRSFVLPELAPEDYVAPESEADQEDPGITDDNNNT